MNRARWKRKTAAVARWYNRIEKIGGTGGGWRSSGWRHVEPALWRVIRQLPHGSQAPDLADLELRPLPEFEWGRPCADPSCCPPAMHEET